jgi:glycine betaine/choline ABC-type transport system substrate-binding protein
VVSQGPRREKLMVTVVCPRTLFTLVATLFLALGVAACGGGDDDGRADISANLIERNPRNSEVRIAVGSKDFTEQFILGEIYSQALEAAGYDVRKRLDLGPERIAFGALEKGHIDAYPEYTSTALTSFFYIPAEDVPADAQQAFENARDDFAERGVRAFPPTPFSSANAVGLQTERADALGVTSISDLEGRAKDLTLAGSPECRGRADCLVGLVEGYGLDFEKFTAVDIDRRYKVLDKGDADLSILFTTDPQLFVSDNYVVLEDDRNVMPAGNVLFVAREQTVSEAGPDLPRVVKSVQKELSLEVMQKLNARVDIDGQTPAEAARLYLEQFGYVQ